jgi:hypothetical protein
MPDSTIDRLFLMLEAQAKLASAERSELTKAFERQLTGLRWELRGIALTAAVIVLALSGIGVKLRAPGVDVQTSPDQSVVSVNVDPATPAEAEPAPYVPDPADADHAPLE